jgi:murein DD-endopeptidase MepM/ murein hydrolase activator NlpD
MDDPLQVATTSPATADAAESLRERDLVVPVDDVDREDLHDTFTDTRGSRSHEALDILARRGTHVIAVEDGRIEKLFTSKAGGLTIYQFDPTRTFAYYYAHLDRYADGLVEGRIVKRGDVIGYVGSTGNASPDAPHLHFAIFRLGPERQWWKGEPINPYPILAAK